MTNEKIKRMFDAFYQAKRIRDMLPPLPQGVMETKGYLQKLMSPDDGRVTYISITEKGERLSRKYDQDYFSSLAPYLSEISEEEADNMIRTIGKFYQIMCDRREHYDK